MSKPLRARDVETIYDDVVRFPRTTAVDTATVSVAPVMPSAFPDAASLIDAATRAKNGANVSSLMRGDIGEYKSQSEARAALLGMLAFYTHDADVLEAVMRASGLDPERWDTRRGGMSFIRYEIARACVKVPVEYTSPSAAGPVRHGETQNGTASVNENEFNIAKEITVERVDWLWRNWMPYGMITMLDGDPGVGKSFMALELAARMSVGAPMPPSNAAHDPRKARGVALFMPEDVPSMTTVPRLIAMGADLSRIVITTAVFDASSPEGVARITRAAEAVDAGMIVFDPLVTYLGPEKANVHLDRDVRRVLDPIVQLATRKRIVILANRHLNKKSKESSAIYAGMGSIGIGAVARSVMVTAINPETKQGNVLASAKLNLGPRPASLTWHLEPDADDEDLPPRIVWDGDCDVSADALVTGPAVERGPSQVAQAAERIKAIILASDGGVAKWSDIVGEMCEEFSAGTMQRARVSLGLVQIEKSRGPGTSSTVRLP